MGSARQPIPGKQPGWNGRHRRRRPRIISTRRRRWFAGRTTTIPNRRERRRAMQATRTILAEQFDSLEQQHEASRLGLWTFLVTEILFFVGLYTAYTNYLFSYPHSFA